MFPGNAARRTLGVAGLGKAAQHEPLPAFPEKLPSWIDNKQKNHIFYKRGRYNFAVYNLPKLGTRSERRRRGSRHGLRGLVTGKAAGLETKTFERDQPGAEEPAAA